jgi:hypothetical protein
MKFVMIFVKLILGFVLGTVALFILSLGLGEKAFYTMLLAFIGALALWASYRVYQLVAEKNAQAAAKFLRYAFAIILISSPGYLAALAIQTFQAAGGGVHPDIWIVVVAAIPNLIILLLLLSKFTMPFNEGFAAGMVWFTFCTLIGYGSMALELWLLGLSLIPLLLIFIIGCVAFCYMRIRAPQTANATEHRIIGLIFGTVLAVGYLFIFFVSAIPPYH